jgi:hypothetical protein
MQIYRHVNQAKSLALNKHRVENVYKPQIPFASYGSKNRLANIMNKSSTKTLASSNSFKNRIGHSPFENSNISNRKNSPMQTPYENSNTPNISMRKPSFEQPPINRANEAALKDVLASTKVESPRHHMLNKEEKPLLDVKVNHQEPSDQDESESDMISVEDYKGNEVKPNPYENKYDDKSDDGSNFHIPKI